MPKISAEKYAEIVAKRKGSKKYSAEELEKRATRIREITAEKMAKKERAARREAKKKSSPLRIDIINF